MVDKFGAFTSLVEVNAGNHRASDLMEPSQDPLGLLKRSSGLIATTFAEVARIKGSAQQETQSVLKASIVNLKLLLMASLAACKRNRILVRFNHELLAQILQAQTRAGLSE